jgi:hypothetical protein
MQIRLLSFEVLKNVLLLTGAKIKINLIQLDCQNSTQPHLLWEFKATQEARFWYPTLFC